LVIADWFFMEYDKVLCTYVYLHTFVVMCRYFHLSATSKARGRITSAPSYADGSLHRPSLDSGTNAVH
jgi:hypothetical protein